VRLTRRRLLQLGISALAAAVSPPLRAQPLATRPLRIAFLHLAPVPGEVARNRSLVEAAIVKAAEREAAWIITPELCVSGYTFSDRIGTDWILPQPDAWMAQVCRLASRLQVTVFLSHPERDGANTLYNSLFVIAPDGAILGSHRKIHTLRVGSEAWSTPGKQAVAVAVPPVGPVGLLICADMSSAELCRSLRTQGARLLVSAAAWGPGVHGPSGEWERCSRETGLPVVVCNRTGPDRTLDFTRAESVVVKDGTRLLSFASARSAVVLVDWDLTAQTLLKPDPEVVFL
jgi:predicted amidohydrolase